ncbi:MAG: hypothetical protein JOY79_06835, partial [Acidobacteriaceae bacterium]|nr:hypothetical protein [Acidobacteriaceae bacterium]
MTTYGFGKEKIINGGGPSGGAALRALGLGVLLFIFVIVFFSAVTRVPSGHVGVLTLFGRVTG